MAHKQHIQEFLVRSITQNILVGIYRSKYIKASKISSKILGTFTSVCERRK